MREMMQKIPVTRHHPGIRRIVVVGTKGGHRVRMALHHGTARGHMITVHPHVGINEHQPLPAGCRRPRIAGHRHARANRKGNHPEAATLRRRRHRSTPAINSHNHLPRRRIQRCKRIKAHLQHLTVTMSGNHHTDILRQRHPAVS